MKKILTPKDLEPINRLKNGPLKALLGAYKILTKPKRWTKGAFAKNSRGEHVALEDGSATCFCTWGAVKRAAIEADLKFSDGSRAYDLLDTQLGGSIALPQFNDSDQTKRKDVLTLLAKVIKRESRGRIVLPEALA